MVELFQEFVVKREKGNHCSTMKNYKKQIWLKGSFAKVLGTSGITGNTGSSDEWKIDGVDNNPGDNPDTLTIPTMTQAIRSMRLSISRRPVWPTLLRSSPWATSSLWFLSEAAALRITPVPQNCGSMPATQ